MGITISSLLSVALQYARVVEIKKAQDIQVEKFTVTYRDPESAAKFIDTFNKNLLKRASRIRTEAPENYQRPAAATLTSELHSEENRLIHICTGSHSAAILIARLQKHGELEYYNKTQQNAFANFFNSKDAAKAVAAESGRSLGARLKYGRPVPGAICSSCFRVVNAQLKSYTSNRSLCAGPPREPATPTPRLVVPATSTPNVNQESVRRQTHSQCSPALELPDLSKV